jgi:hypothetical protein
MDRIGRMTALHSRALAQRAESDGTAAQDATLPGQLAHNTLGGEVEQQNPRWCIVHGVLATTATARQDWQDWQD